MTAKLEALACNVCIGALPPVDLEGKLAWDVMVVFAREQSVAEVVGQ